MLDMYRYKNTLTLVVSFLVALGLFFGGYLHALTHLVGGYGYVTAFISGMLFSISVTAPIASLIFFELGDIASPVVFAIVGGLGAMVSDVFLYRFLKTSLLEEWKLIVLPKLSFAQRQQMELLTKRRIFIWTVPLLASALIASPLPDELGVALFSVINFHPKYFSLISFLANMIGIFALLSAGGAVL